MKEKSKERQLRLKIVGRFLKAARQKAGLTQQEVARCLSYSSSQFVSNWERGASLPPLDTMPRLAELFKVSPRSFLEILHRYQDELLKLQKRELVDIFKEAFPRAI